MYSVDSELYYIKFRLFDKLLELDNDKLLSVFYNEIIILKKKGITMGNSHRYESIKVFQYTDKQNPRTNRSFEDKMGKKKRFLK